VELREYLKIFQKHFWLILISIILIAAGAFIFVKRQKIAYEANGDLTVVPKANEQLKNVYEYDGYYALQAATVFNTTVSAWLQSPNTVTEIYQKAGYEINQNTKSKALSKTIKTTLMPQSFSLRFRLQDPDKEKVAKLAKSTVVIIQDRTNIFNQKAGSKLNYEISASEPVIIENRPPVTLYTVAGLFAGLVLGLFLSLLLEYFKKT